MPTVNEFRPLDIGKVGGKANFLGGGTSPRNWRKDYRHDGDGFRAVEVLGCSQNGWFWLNEGFRLINWRYKLGKKIKVGPYQRKRGESDEEADAEK